MDSIKFSEHSLRVLEWAKLCEAIEEKCRSENSKKLAQEMKPGLLSQKAAKQRAQAILELGLLYSQNELKLPLKEHSSLDPVLKRVERSGWIAVEEFHQLVISHQHSQSLHHFLKSYGASCPNLLQVLSGYDPLEQWSNRVFPLLDSRGEIVDSASEDLEALRFLSRDLAEKIKKRLDDFLKDRRLADFLQDQYVTLRDGRYVLPIKSNFKGKVPGIIHDVSNTEHTIFIEPQEVVDWNNQLKVTEKEIEKEIEKILRAVVAETAKILKPYRKNLEILNHADFLNAAYFCTRRWGEIPSASPEWGEKLEFKKLRHPLLAFNEDVVPNDLSWEGVLVLSGPNTGGKTVLLKSIGMAVAMASAGLPIPAEWAEIPASLRAVHVDIGDEQNMSNHLSTFSAHLKIIQESLEEADENTLVLIDEMATGTSPEEGQPLAQAVLEEYLKRKSQLFVTTHYSALKHFAMNHEGCKIAAMAVDPKTQKPSYQLIPDVPGESSAIATAENLGFSKSLLDRARELRGQGNEEVSKASRLLDQARRKFNEREKELEQRIKDLRHQQKQAELREQDFNKKVKLEVQEKAGEILGDLKKQREDLSSAIKEAQKNPPQDSSRLFHRVSELNQQLKDIVRGEEASEIVAKPLSENVQEGDWVQVLGLGMGQIETLPKDFESSEKAMVLVKVGEIKSRVAKNRLMMPSEKAMKQQKQQLEIQREADWRKQKSRTLSRAHDGDPSASSICDVRGNSVEQAMSRVEKALNSFTVEEDFSTLTIIHGHGFDRLKEELRRYLKNERPDCAFRPGSWPGEGGDGVTVVEKA